MIHDEILHKWINNTISVEELKKFKKRPEYEELVELYKKTDDLAAPGFDANTMLKEILAAPKEEQTVETETEDENKQEADGEAKVVSFPNWLKLAVAASVLFMFGFGAVFLSSKTNTVKYTATNQSTKNVELPDGSTFDLAAKSNLEYSEKNWVDKRIVHLSGEATFRVAKGNSFTVLTPFGKVDVLGTVFTVFAANNSLNVHCKEGKVSISNLKGELPAILEANESASMIKEQQLIARKQKNTLFEDVPLKDLVNALSKEFDVRFDTGKLNTEELVTCKFPTGSLDKAMEICFKNQGINSRKKEGTIILSQ